MAQSSAAAAVSILEGGGPIPVAQQVTIPRCNNDAKTSNPEISETASKHRPIAVPVCVGQISVVLIRVEQPLEIPMFTSGGAGQLKEQEPPSKQEDAAVGVQRVLESFRLLARVGVAFIGRGARASPSM